MERLAQELIDKIVGYFWEDSPTLRHCALVCRSWSYPSRSHLFSSLTVDVQEGKTGHRYISDWKSALDASPEIRGYIRLVTVYGARWENTVEPFVAEASTVLAILENLASLTLTGILWPRTGTAVNLFSAGAMQLHCSVSRLVLTDVVFDTADDLFQFIREFSSLAHLELHFTTWTQTSYDSRSFDVLEPPPRSSMSRLTRLDIANPSSWNILIRFLITHFRIELSSIRIRWVAAHYLPLAQVSGDYLRSIEVDFYRAEENLTGLIISIPSSSIQN